MGTRYVLALKHYLNKFLSYIIIMNTLKLVVRNIIGAPNNGVSRVTVATDVYNATVGYKPLLPYEAMGDSDGGDGVRLFTIGGVELYTHQVKLTNADGSPQLVISQTTGNPVIGRFTGQPIQASKILFFMKTEDAEKCQMSLEEQRANAPRAAFRVKDFDLSIVASAQGPQVAA